MHPHICSTQEQVLDLFEKEQPRVEAMLLVLTHNPCLVQDILQDLYIWLYEHWSEYDASYEFGPYVRTIARNMAYTAFYAHKRYQALLQEHNREMMIASVLTVGADDSELERRIRALRPCLSGMRPAHRHVIHFRFFNPLPYEEISAITGRSVGALQALFRRVKPMLLKCVKRRLAQDEL